MVCSFRVEWSVTRQSWLSWFLKGVLALGFLVLFARLFELQILKGSYFQALAEENRIRRVSILAPRGQILARGGEVLAQNQEVSKWLVFDPQKGFEKKEVINETPAEEIIHEPQREYPFNSLLAHAIGYLGEVDESEVGSVDPGCSVKGEKIAGSWVGRGGLEEEYDCRLRGVNGEELVEVDAFGKKKRTIGRKDPIPGEDLQTNIDLLLQQKLAEVMQGYQGAAVITDTEGAVLAFYSAPAYDANAFVAGDKDQITSFLTNEDLPLFNRVVGGAYHPGSIFKLVTATGALAESRIDTDYTYEDTGEVRVNDFSYTNWYFTQYGGTEGVIDLERALARSTDTFFYKLGEALGANALSDWAFKFGLGAKTGVDLPGEVSGLVPTPEWKKRVKNENWFLGNTYHLAIGQGDLAVTPLAANQMTSVIAADGLWCSPRLVDQGECRDLQIDAAVIEEVKKGMVQACETGGTAFPFFDFSEKADITVACKTGTAETNEEDKTHAWFTIFAPADEPEIVATFLVEKGGEGSSTAAPLAREVFDYYFGVRDEIPED